MQQLEEKGGFFFYYLEIFDYRIYKHKKKNSFKTSIENVVKMCGVLPPPHKKNFFFVVCVCYPEGAI
jgi:hypothetical protein